MKKGLLIILSGPYGVGKGTVRKYVFENIKTVLNYSVSMTTREIRTGEVNGKDYWFVSKEEFENNLKNDNLLEHAKFVGNYYGTPKDKVEELRNQGKHVFLEIEINGATQVLKKYQNDSNVISLFLMPPSVEALENRIRNRRTESEEIIKERLEKGQKEMAFAEQYDYTVINDKIENAGEKIISLIEEKVLSLQ